MLQKCDRIQNSLLRSIDQDLYDHLCSLEIEPQLYALYVMVEGVRSLAMLTRANNLGAGCAS